MVLSRAEYESIGAGSSLFRQGDRGEKFYILLSGRVNIIKVTRLGKEREERVVASFGPGASFGELALLEDGGTRTASAIAEEDCEFLTLTRANFKEVKTTLTSETFKRQSEFLLSLPVFAEYKIEVERLERLEAEGGGGGGGNNGSNGSNSSTNLLPMARNQSSTLFQVLSQPEDGLDKLSLFRSAAILQRQGSEAKIKNSGDLLSVARMARAASGVMPTAARPGFRAATLFTREVVKRGDVAAKEGAVSDTVKVLMEGEVEMMRTSTVQVVGGKARVGAVRVALAGVGTWVGGFSALTGQPEPYTATVASSGGVFLSIPASNFAALRASTHLILRRELSMRFQEWAAVLTSVIARATAGHPKVEAQALAAASPALQGAQTAAPPRVQEEVEALLRDNRGRVTAIGVMLGWAAKELEAIEKTQQETDILADEASYAESRKQFYEQLERDALLDRPGESRSRSPSPGHHRRNPSAQARARSALDHILKTHTPSPSKRRAASASPKPSPEGASRSPTRSPAPDHQPSTGLAALFDHSISSDPAQWISKIRNVKPTPLPHGTPARLKRPQSAHVEAFTRGEVPSVNGRSLSPERVLGVGGTDGRDRDRSQRLQKVHSAPARPATAVVDRARRLKALRDEREAALKRLQGL